ncbi:MAG: NlpC/P60 family protein, partial [Ignavibacteria bacterium]|nr:NlpC/P60 family protein [Ignavibacteria bacterium]
MINISIKFCIKNNGGVKNILSFHYLLDFWHKYHSSPLERIKVRIKMIYARSLLLILFSAVLFLSSCSSTKPIARTSSNIHSLDTKNPELKNETENETAKNIIVSKKEGAALQKKYSAQLNTGVSLLQNLLLLKFIDEWYGVPYKYAGDCKDGIDCSGFTCALINNVYNKNIDGTSARLHELSKPIKKDDLKEGDLVFFKINKGKISHVGVYLYNNYFIHASTKA